MMDEHFGISVVEFMVSLLRAWPSLQGLELMVVLYIQAAGLIPLVHASAGPLLDIVVPLENGQITGKFQC